MLLVGNGLVNTNNVQSKIIDLPAPGKIMELAHL